MSVDLQAPQSNEKFAVSSTQFEEIIPNRDERSTFHTSERDSREEMDKESDLDEHTSKVESKERKKSPLKSDYSSDDYDDDFEDSEPLGPKKANEKELIPESERRKSIPRQRRNSSRSTERSLAKSPSVISPRSDRKSNIISSKKRKSHGYASSYLPASSVQTEYNYSKRKNKSANVKATRLDQSFVDGVMLASRRKETKLENKLSELRKELVEEQEENKTLRHIHIRQETKLTRLCGEDAELPRLLAKHANEVKSLREMTRRLHDTCGQKDHKINEQDKEILKLKDRCKHYKDLGEMKNLPERAELQNKLTQAESNLDKSDSEISKLQRTVNLKEKAHARRAKEQNEKLREMQARLNEMVENYNNQQDRIKVMSKQLDNTNLYQRQIVLKEKGKNNNALPEAPPKMAALPAPKRTKPKTKNPNNTSYTNKSYKGEAKGEERIEANKKHDPFFLTTQSDTGSDKELDKSREVVENGEEPRLSITDGSEVLGMGSSTSNNENIFLEDDVAKANERRKKEDFERTLREEDERLNKEKEELQWKRNEEEERSERERVEREEKWREESAKRAREVEEQREASVRRAREEDERKKAEEIKEDTLKKQDSFFDDDEESRRKKDLLLARLKAMDDGKVADDEPYHSDSKRLSSGKSGDEPVKPRGLKKGGYEARSADENLHNGLPALANENRITSPVSVKSDPDSIVGIPRHKPVLLGRMNLAKKSNARWLENDKKPSVNNKVKRSDDFNFGDYSPSMSDSKKKPADTNGDIFESGLSRPPARGRRALADNGLDFGERRGSLDKPKTNLPFLTDDFGSKRNTGVVNISPTHNEPLLPRRRRVQEVTGPAISSRFDDNLEDGIEELTL